MKGSRAVVTSDIPSMAEDCYCSTRLDQLHQMFKLTEAFEFSGFVFQPNGSKRLKLYPSLRTDAGIERMFDLTHFGDQVGGFN